MLQIRIVYSRQLLIRHFACRRSRKARTNLLSCFFQAYSSILWVVFEIRQFQPTNRSFRRSKHKKTTKLEKEIGRQSYNLVFASLDCYIISLVTFLSIGNMQSLGSMNQQITASHLANLWQKQPLNNQMHGQALRKPRINISHGQKYPKTHKQSLNSKKRQLGIISTADQNLVPHNFNPIRLISTPILLQKQWGPVKPLGMIEKTETPIPRQADHQIFVELRHLDLHDPCQAGLEYVFVFFEFFGRVADHVARFGSSEEGGFMAIDVKNERHRSILNFLLGKELLQIDFPSNVLLINFPMYQLAVEPPRNAQSALLGRHKFDRIDDIVMALVEQFAALEVEVVQSDVAFVVARADYPLLRQFNELDVVEVRLLASGDKVLDENTFSANVKGEEMLF